MKPLLALLALLLCAAAPVPVATGPAHLCPSTQMSGDCRPVDLRDVRFDTAETILVRTVTVDPAALPLARPSMVWVIALASSEVRWNGVVIGRNGRPGPDRASERPGRFVATFVVPPRLVRPGENLVSVRLSSHRLWLPVRTPVHDFSVSPYETPTLPGLRDYLPAMLMLGALAAAFIYFGAAAISDRRDRGALLVASIAASAAAQLVVEVSRAFIAYTYPWHLARVTTIALLAALSSVLAAAYAARRFSPSWVRNIVVTTAAASLAMLVLVPWYDLKAMGAVLVGTVALAACAFPRLRQGRRDAQVALGAAAAILLAMIWQRTRFLDQAYYFIVAGLLVALVVEQVNRVRQIRAERDLETRRAEALAERLARAERDGERIIALKDGSRAYRVAEGDIVYARAADDYCDVVLRDGRSLLVTMSLARLVGALPRFVRVHKSYAVNRQYVTTISPRSGGGRELELSDGTAIPVGRSYTSSLASWT